MAVIEIKNLTKIYGNNPERAMELISQGFDNEAIRKQTKQVVGIKNVSFSVEHGESFVIMGLSGSGKSTLLRCLNALNRPNSGEIWIDGQNLMGLNKKGIMEIRRTKMAMIFQSFALLPHRTVGANVAYGLEIQGLPAHKRTEMVQNALEMVGLGQWMDVYPHQLSGGMQQRVGIARALATNPDILLMDEPFSALDPLIRQDMQDELIALQQKLQKTIVFITHDLDEALKIGDHIALMKDGEIVQIGDPEEILLSPATDYVARFVENVDRSKALSASAVMVRAHSITYPKEGPMAALHSMERFGISGIFVVDRNQHLLGYLSAEDADQLVSRRERNLDEIMQKKVPVVSPDTSLYDLLDTMAHTPIPIAVVDENGQLRGTLVRGSVIAGLAGERRKS
ncbi:MAG: glycine betaine/L-proline ABC transporter ATP-binding protein [Syntrophomonas sp.]|nr:glycine betaine/L-proline ABC transporter ATP-binding protein [Syntrophomonas sp.]